jgi:colicin import membrane protein
MGSRTFPAEPIWKLRGSAFALSALAHGAVAVMLALHWVPEGLGIGPEGIPVDIVAIEDATAETASTGSVSDAKPDVKPAREARPLPSPPQYQEPRPYQATEDRVLPKPVAPPDEPIVEALRPAIRERPQIAEGATSPQPIEQSDLSVEYLQDSLVPEPIEAPVEETAEPAIEQMDAPSDAEAPVAEPVEEATPSEEVADTEPLLEATAEPMPETLFSELQALVPQEPVTADTVSASSEIADAKTDSADSAPSASLLTSDAPVMANPGDSELDEPPLIASSTSGTAGLELALTAREIEALREQLYGCWQLPEGLSRSDNVRVVVRIEVAPNRLVLRADLDKGSGTINHPLYRSVADSAQRAIRGCGPLNLPAHKYQAWATMRITFESIYGGSYPSQPASPVTDPLPAPSSPATQEAALVPDPLLAQPALPDSISLPASSSNESAANSSDAVELTVREITAIQRQLIDCWVLPRRIDDGGEIRVPIQVTFAPDGTVLAAEFAEPPTPTLHPSTEAVALSALKAVHDCSPIAMPAGKYEAWKSFRMTFVTG